MKKCSVFLSFLVAASCVAGAQAADRPPQFIAMAFDNCTELERWQELTDFVSEMNRDGDRVHFTFFVSGTNFIADQNRNSYEGPGQRRGTSPINFGGSAEDVRRRVDYANRLFQGGHEIASHAVGHFDGRNWSAADWSKEFNAFNDALDKVAQNGATEKFLFPTSRVAGFRAPYLKTSPGLYTTLTERGYRYDASGDSAADAWPEKTDGLWRFNLAKLTLHNMGKSTLSMDYNFFVLQSRAVPDPATSSHQLLGLKTEATLWSEETSGTRLTPLTAAGYGNPSFAASYVECQGAFGLHDDVAGVASGARIAYLVAGWYSNLKDDPICATEGETAACLKYLNWRVSSGDAPEGVDGSLYVGSVVGVQIGPASGGATALPDVSRVKVAVGNTAAEALSALLGSGHDTTIAGLNAETLLNAAQAGVLDHLTEPDGPMLVTRALHDRTFEHADGGRLWQITRRETQDPGTAQDDHRLRRSTLEQGEIALPENIAALLDRLNQAQFAFDRAQALVLSQRRLLFADVCRFLSDSKTTILQSIVDAMVDSINVATGQEAASDANTPNLPPGAAIVPEAFSDLKNALAPLKKAIAALPAQETVGWQLTTGPAPRCHRPADPVVLISDESPASPLAPSPPDNLPGSDGSLACRLSGDVKIATGPGVLPANWAVGPGIALIEGLAEEARAVPGTAAWTNSWRPVLMGWEAQVIPAVTAQPDYVPNALTGEGGYQLDGQGTDLMPRAAPGSSFFTNASPAIYNGRVVLSGHAMGSLRGQIARVVGEQGASSTELDTSALPSGLAPAVDLLTKAYSSGARTLSQSLHGFHDRLLMLRRTIQLDVHDPGGQLTQNSDSPAAVGRQGLASPQLSDIYSPIRTGYCQLTQLYLIDAFGQKLHLAVLPQPGSAPSEVTIAAPLASAYKVPPGFFALAPRLCQPSRLLFRFMAADPAKNEIESNQHPATSPVCGWVVLNRLDESLMLFNADGKYAGSVSATSGTYDSHGLAVGATMQTAIRNPLTLQVAQYLTSAQAVAAQAFDAISTQLLTIAPRSHRESAGLSVLVSRPLALVRAALRLELEGAPSPDQGYLRTDPSRIVSQAVPGFIPFLHRDTRGFPEVQFPVYLGDPATDDDGLVLYFRLPATGSPLTLGAYYKTADDVPISLVCNDLAATQVLMLVDPRAGIHATTGILPAKRLTIPPDYYAEAVQKMEILFRVGPVLTPADTAQMPLPAETRSMWTWLAEGAGSMPVSGKVDDRAHLSVAPPILRRGWLAIKPYGGETPGQKGRK